jgi:hypothetical protein
VDSGAPLFAPAVSAATTLGTEGRRPDGCHTPLCGQRPQAPSGIQESIATTAPPRRLVFIGVSLTYSTYRDPSLSLRMTGGRRGSTATVPTPVTYSTYRRAPLRHSVALFAPLGSVSLDSQSSADSLRIQFPCHLKGTQGLATRLHDHDPDPDPSSIDSPPALTSCGKPQSHTHPPSAAAPASSPVSVP